MYTVGTASVSNPLYRRGGFFNLPSSPDMYLPEGVWVRCWMEGGNSNDMKSPVFISLPPPFFF